MRLFVLSCLLLLLLGNAPAQSDNLVLNGGFEKLTENNPCRYTPNTEVFNRSATSWSTYRGMTPDLIHWVPDAYGDCFFPKPHSGKGAVGIITYLPAVDLGQLYGFHELIVGQLRFPLQPGQAYEVSMHIHKSDSTAIDHLERLYSEGHPIRPTAAGDLGVGFFFREPRWRPDRDFEPQVLFKEPIITPQGEWVKISQTFVADRAYLHFAIGNFSKGFDTPTTLPDATEIDSLNRSTPGFADRPKRIAYYCLDNISVRAVEKPTAKSVLTKQLEEKSTYTFKNVNFETNKWELLPKALPELKALAEYLNENPDKKAQIIGHTDAVGQTEANRILSEKRAESVCRYLIAKGVTEERLTWEGKGEEQPIASNESAKGREENRRVEVKIQ